MAPGILISVVWNARRRAHSGGGVQESRSFLPTWFAVAGILGVQMVILALMPDPLHMRSPAWSGHASIVAFFVVVTASAAWAFPRVRAMSWLIGAICVMLVAMQHTVVVGHGQAPPPVELFAFYTAAAVLLAAGAWERARRAG